VLIIDVNMYYFVQGIGSSIAGVFGTLIIIAIIGIISVIGWLGYGGYKLATSSDEQVIEANHKIIPTIKLHTDGKTVDTIYVYTYKQ